MVERLMAGLGSLRTALSEYLMLVQVLLATLSLMTNFRRSLDSAIVFTLNSSRHKYLAEEPTSKNLSQIAKEPPTKNRKRKSLHNASHQRHTLRLDGAG